MVDSPRLVLYPLQGLQLWLSERAGQQLLIFPGGHGPGAGPGDPQGFGLGQAQQGTWEETKTVDVKPETSIEQLPTNSLLNRPN